MAFYGNRFRVPDQQGGEPEELNADEELVAAEFALDLIRHATRSTHPRDAGEAQRAVATLTRDPVDAQGAPRRLAGRAGAALDRIPWFTRGGLAGLALASRTLAQVTRYLTDSTIRDHAIGQLTARLTPDTRAVVGHSLGSVVAYEALRARRAEEGLPLLITLGSPSGCPRSTGGSGSRPHIPPRSAAGSTSPPPTTSPPPGPTCSPPSTIIGPPVPSWTAPGKWTTAPNPTTPATTSPRPAAGTLSPTPSIDSRAWGYWVRGPSRSTPRVAPGRAAAGTTAPPSPLSGIPLSGTPPSAADENQPHQPARLPSVLGPGDRPPLLRPLDCAGRGPQPASWPRSPAAGSRSWSSCPRVLVRKSQIRGRRQLSAERSGAGLRRAGGRWL